MIVKRCLLGATLLGLGLFLPTAAYSATSVVMTSETALSTVDTLSQADSISASEATLNIEARLEPQADGRITSEITFSGNANEVIVLFVEREDGLLPWVQTDLYTAAGEKVRSRRNYPDFMTLDDFSRNSRTFLLPETGDYRLILESVPSASVVGRNSSVVDNTAYSVQVRNATYYERLLMSAEAFADDGVYEAAFSRLALAVDDSPEIPSAYLYRVFAYAEMLYESPEFEARLDELDESENASAAEFSNAFFPLVYETFLTLPADDQSLVVGDIRQLNSLYLAAIASGEIDLDNDEFGEVPFDGIASFLETGVPTDAMRMLFFGTSASSKLNLRVDGL
mgnify:CR=1 FL=1